MVFSEYVPFAHAVHEVNPAVVDQGVTDPSAHVAHETAPAVAYLPALHVTQLELPALTVAMPALHAKQVEAAPSE